MDRMHRVACALILVAAGLPARAAEIVIVTPSVRPTLTLTREQLADIFLGRSLRLPDGRRVTPIDQREGAPAREAFYLAYTGKSAAQVKAHWAKIIFTGRGQPPRQVADGREAKQRLSRDPDAITYLEAAQVDDSVRVVEIR